VRLVCHEADASGRRPVRAESAGPSRRQPPTVKILDATGRTLGSYKAGWQGAEYAALWQVPPGVKGTFTAIADNDFYGFPIESRKATFVVK
jgi:membrane peptidoglycan carboxypeptidase